MTTHASALAAAGEKLSAVGIDGAMRDAELLLRHVTQLDGAALSVRLNDPLSADMATAFDTAVSARAERQPLSHITGGRLFWGRWFEVTPDVLDPRPESETMIAAALDRPENTPPPGKVLDLGVGSGCLLGTMLAELPDATGMGIDASRAALNVARANLVAQGVEERARLQIGDWLDDMLEAFDLILCNPPYIAETEMQDLSPEVRNFEPHLALTPGGDGLDPYRRIAPELAAFLRRGGRALFEIGPTEGAEVAAVFGAFGWPDPIVHKDFDGRDRCLEYRRK